MRVPTYPDYPSVAAPDRESFQTNPEHRRTDIIPACPKNNGKELGHVPLTSSHAALAPQRLGKPNWAADQIVTGLSGSIELRIMYIMLNNGRRYVGPSPTSPI